MFTAHCTNRSGTCALFYRDICRAACSCRERSRRPFYQQSFFDPKCLRVGALLGRRRKSPFCGNPSAKRGRRRGGTSCVCVCGRVREFHRFSSDPVARNIFFKCKHRVLLLVSNGDAFPVSSTRTSSFGRRHHFAPDQETNAETTADVDLDKTPRCASLKKTKTESNRAEFCCFV